MCKVLAISNLSKVKSIDKLINTIADEMSKVEDDGFGYAIHGQDGVFGERIVENEGFRTNFKNKILDAPFAYTGYNRIGTKSKAIGAGIFHGRTSTNDRTLLNTHPIVKHGWTLIHNGVVNDHGPKYKMITTNDTEHVLERLATQGIKAVEEHLTGYYAVAALDPQGDLHIFRDSIAPLYVATIDNLDGAYIFATTKSLIENTCNTMKWQHSVVAQMHDDSYLIFVKGQVSSYTDIKPRGRTWAEDKHAEKSLGYKIESEDYSPRGYGYRAGDLKEPTSAYSSTSEAAWQKLWDEKQILTKSEASFLDEVKNYADDSYIFLDYNEERVTFEEFMLLSDDEMLYCTVVRADGTIVDPVDYEAQRLYEGKVA